MRIRVKFHRFSGDVSKELKIQMLESREAIPMGWYTITPTAIRSYRKTLKMRQRAVSKRQTERFIREALGG